MFTVIDVRHRFFIWVSVTLRANADMVITEKRLRFGTVGAPVLDTRTLGVKADQALIIHARRSDGYRIGDQVPPKRVANKLPLGLKWQTVQTA